MVVNLYSMFDCVSAEYQHNLLAYKTDALCLRDVSYSVRVANNPTLMDDLSVFRIGTFDTETGKVESVNPVMIARCSEFVRKESEDDRKD